MTSESSKESKRRTQLRDGIPSSVSLPKFLAPEEILRIKEIKATRPYFSWDEVVEIVVADGLKKKPRKSSASKFNVARLREECRTGLRDSD